MASAHANALEPQVNQLTIAGAPAEGAAGAGAITLDGEPVSVDELGKPLAVDPGDHTVTITSPGQPPRTFSAHVEAGALATTVTLGDAAGPSPAPPLIAPLPPSPPPADADDLAARTPRHWIGAELIGAGLAGQRAALAALNGDLDAVTAVGGGLIVYLSAPKRTSVAVVVAPTPLPGGGGATLQGSF